MFGTLSAPLNSPLYTGSGSSTLVPRPYSVAINGHVYVPDFSFEPWKRQAYQHQSVDAIRDQADSSSQPGEGSLNLEGLWRRTQDSWHHGAGQLHLDRKNSDTYRFRTSKGVNPWTPWRMTLHYDTSQIQSSSATNLALVVAGSRLYKVDGITAGWTATLAGGSTSWTPVTGLPGTTISSVCSDGFNVYFACGASGIYWTNTGTNVAAQLVTDNMSVGTTVLGFVRGRLMVGWKNALYNVTSVVAAALPAALFTSNYSNLAFVGFGESQGKIYAAGFSGDVSQIYSIGITSDASALSAPVSVAQLNSGEVVRCILGYASRLIIGTDAGIRVASVDIATGNLAVGSLIGSLSGLSSSVKCLAGYDKYVWFGWTNYDSTSTGLGRLDLSTDTSPQVPAFASDLMVTGQGTVLSAVAFGGTICMAVSALGFYQQATTYVTSGNFTTGAVTLDLLDNKVPVFVDLTYLPLSAGTIQTSLALDGAAAASVGTASVVGSTFVELPTTQTLAYSMELTETLTSGSVNTVTPTLTRHTLRSLPAPVTPTKITAALRFDEELLVGDSEVPFRPYDELSYLEGLRTTKQVVVYQEASQSYSVMVINVEWVPESTGRDGTQWNGVAVVHMRTVV